MHSIASFFPQNYFIFLLHDKVVLYRFNTAFWDQKEFKEKKPSTMLKLTPKGRKAFDEYRKEMKNALKMP